MSAPPTGTAPPRLDPGAPVAKRRPRRFAVLAGSRNFRLLVTGQAVSACGDMFFLVAVPFLILDGEPGATATLTATLLALGVARLATTLPAGWLVDRIGPRAVMLGADAIRAGAVAVLAVAAWHGRPATGLLIGVAVVLGAAEGGYRPASKAIIPTLVHDTELATANSVNVTATLTATVVGPALGGIGVGLASPAVMLVLDAGTFLVSVFTLLSIRGGPRAAADGDGDGDRKGDGKGDPDEPRTVLAFLRRSAFFRVAIVMMALIGLSIAGTLQVALPVLADRTPELGVRGYGYLRAGLGAGMILGGLAGGFAARLRRQGALVIGLIAAEGALLALVPALPPPTFMVAGMLAVGAIDGALAVVVVTALQRRPPARLRGRVLAVLTFVGFAMFPISVALSGTVVSAVSPEAMFGLTAAGFVVVAAVGAASRQLRHARGDTREGVS